MKISHQETVVSFELDESIALSCGSAIKELQKMLGGRILSINTPEDAPPPMPRVILRMKDSVVNLGLDRVQITTFPPSHVSDDIEKSSKFTFHRVEQVLNKLSPSLPEYLWSGVISTLEFPEDPLKNKSGTEAITPVFDTLINIERKGRALSSFQLQYGVEEDFHYITYTISGYERRQFRFDAKQQSGFVRLDPSEHPVYECGIKVLLDINNRPNKSNKDPIKDLETVIEKTKPFADNMAKELNLEGIL